MQPLSTNCLHGSDGSPEHAPCTTASWSALVAYIVTVSHTIHCGVWLYVIGPVAGLAFVAGAGAISIAVKHKRARVSP